MDIPAFRIALEKNKDLIVVELQVFIKFITPGLWSANVKKAFVSNFIGE